jgi:hypothetical protein
MRFDVFLIAIAKVRPGNGMHLADEVFEERQRPIRFYKCDWSAKPAVNRDLWRTGFIPTLCRLQGASGSPG